MRRVSHLNPDYSHFVEVHPTGRYGRYDEVVCRSNSKTVYRSFDEYKGIEVAWNQVKSYDFVQSTDDLKKLDTEISLAKTFKHKNIIKFYTSWLDTATGNINFLTEMFTSTLRQYRLKNRRVSVWTVKHWCRQILRGLVYLHSQDPPVIHRDLRSDNIFINGTQGEVKIGDLGLSGIVRSASFVGTLEFVAPEVYEEAYNELSDIYSMGMCILEMVTSEIPYSECADLFEFFEKLKSEVKPDALYRVNDPEIREFVEKCLAPASLRLSATELLNDPFLQIKDSRSDLRLLDYPRKVNDGFGTPIPESAKYSQRQLQWLGNTNNERYNLVGARSSERNVMAGRKPQDSVTNNPLGVKASVWSVIHAKKQPVSDQASSCYGNNPTIY